MGGVQGGRRFDCAMFDLDGTLADTGADVAWSLNVTLKSVGVPPLETPVVLKHVGGGVRRLLQRCRAEMAPDHAKVATECEEELVRTFLVVYGSHLVVETKLYPGVEETLAGLDGVRRVVMTNKPEAFSRTIVDRLGVGALFEEVVGGDTYPEKKPSPMPLVETLRKMSVAPARAVMVGDSRADLDAAKAAGCASCAVTWGYGSRQDDLSSADYRIASFPELLTVVHG